jgi:cysteinyl-tRNA synthetase
MIKRHLGDTIDIHVGGEDLLFPHHENEIAQSECANGRPFANYWLHNGLINISDKKMSKSGGNCATLRQIADKHGYATVRFWLLSVHYRSPINFGDELLAAAGNGLERIRNCLRSLTELKMDGDVPPQYMQAFNQAMENDLNTANAITAIFDLVRFINSSETKTESMKTELSKMCGILGISVTPSAQTIPNREIEELIERRQAAKNAKNWPEADAIRNRLTEMGVTVKDTKEGVVWHIGDKS